MGSANGNLDRGWESAVFYGQRAEPLHEEGASQPPWIIWLIEVGGNRHHSKTLALQGFALTYMEPN